MTDLIEAQAASQTFVPSGIADCVVFARAGRRFAVPVDAVEAVAHIPALARIPYARFPLLGAGHLGGQIVPIIDLARDGGDGAGAHDAAGEVLRVRTPGGEVGIRVESVEGVFDLRGRGDAAEITMVNPEALAADLNPPRLATGSRSPLGDPGELVPAVSAAPAATFILVEIAGEAVPLRRDEIGELLEALPWTPLPRAPRGLLGVGVLRGTALPVLSLAEIMGLAGAGEPGAYLVAETDGWRAAIAVDRILGLRLQRQASTRRWATPAGGDAPEEEAERIDLAAQVPAELRRIAAGFMGTAPSAASSGPIASEIAPRYLVFAVAGQEFGLPLAAVDRIVEPRPEIRLPRSADAAPCATAIEVRGQIVPVIGLGRPALPKAVAPAAYIILRDGEGAMAIGAERVTQVIAIAAENISPAASAQGPIGGVTTLPAGVLLRLLRPDRLWDGD